MPNEKQLFAYTQTVLRDNGLINPQNAKIFPNGKSPFKHVIYIIRENRTYDQVFGDLAESRKRNKRRRRRFGSDFRRGRNGKISERRQRKILRRTREIWLYVSDCWTDFLSTPKRRPTVITGQPPRFQTIILTRLFAGIIRDAGELTITKVLIVCRRSIRRRDNRRRSAAGFRSSGERKDGRRFL